jgi:nucleoid DNA-binding protein
MMVVVAKVCEQMTQSLSSRNNIQIRKFLRTHVYLKEQNKMRRPKDRDRSCATT